MCFSATASFAAGAGLATAGVATLRLVSRPSEIPFAAIPLLFGAQQLVEGMVWLSFGSAPPLPNPPLTFIYSLFSHVLWPIYVPFAVGLLETVAWRRRALAAMQIAGAVVGLYLLYYLVQSPITSQVLGKHIVYESPHFYFIAVMALYVAATCLSSMLSSHGIVRLFGILALVAFLAAYAIHAATLVSVWCFFAAILSFVVYLYFRGERREDRLGRPSTKVALPVLKDVAPGSQ